jgi:hypothetical protein
MDCDEGARGTLRGEAYPPSDYTLEGCDILTGQMVLAPSTWEKRKIRTQGPAP